MLFIPPLFPPVTKQITVLISSPRETNAKELTGDVRRQIICAIIDLIRLWPRHKDVVESTHSFETVAHVVVQRREKIVVSQIWAVDVFFVERGLRRL